MRCQAGVAIPEWDWHHRLPTGRFVGPVCGDKITTLRINSVFLDVTDQPHLQRHDLTFIVFLLLPLITCAIFSSYLLLFVIEPITFKSAIFDVAVTTISLAFSGFIYWRYVRRELFTLALRPVRFNRKNQRIYAMRERCRRGQEQYGDVVYEVPWRAKNVHFCIHRSKDANETLYHIRCYHVDEQNRIIFAFSIGREWHFSSMSDLLAQWNYWCWYMNKGPAQLPPPTLFLSERETLTETYLTCMFQWGFNTSAAFRLLVTPLTLINTVCRLLSLWTARDPIWPPRIVAACGREVGDEFDQPSGDTPVGWRATLSARFAGTYPDLPSSLIPEWSGTSDEDENAKEWMADRPQRSMEYA